MMDLDQGGPVQQADSLVGNELLDDEGMTNGVTNGFPDGIDDPSTIDDPVQSASTLLSSGLQGGTSADDQPPTSESTFLDTAIDGTIRIWDRRVEAPIARILPPRNTPPWCMGACWSPDGNTFYAGRRNGTVDEYSVHKGFKMAEPNRTFRFPTGSGAVSAVRSMPNGKHLVW